MPGTTVTESDYLAELTAVRTELWRQMEKLEWLMGATRAYCATLPVLTAIGEIDEMIRKCKRATVAA